jgi:hypothetical protein
MRHQDLSAIAHFEMHRRGSLAPDEAVPKLLPAIAGDKETLVALYRVMDSDTLTPLPRIEATRFIKILTLDIGSPL